MIEIKRDSNHISIKGHAHYAEPGKDIVCAGVSTLVQTMVASISEMTTDEIQYVMSKGNLDIKHGNLSEKSKTLIDSFFVGVQMIADNYPDYVRVTEH